MIHEGVVATYLFERLLLRAFHDEAAHDHFLHDEVRLVEIENEVELAHVAEVAVENLDEVVNDVEYDQFIVCLLDAAGEVQ